MKTKITRFLLPVVYGILAAILMFLPAQFSAGPVAAQSSAPECWAIIVGVGNYQYLTDLSWSDDDARDLAAQLSPVWGSDHINLLLDSAATRQAIQNAFTSWLPSREDANDTVLFYWSGYEADTLGYLEPYDSYTTSWNNDISVDTLNGWLNGLDSQQIVICGIGAGTFVNVLANQTGRIMMTPNTVGENYWSVRALGHDIFTYYILEALSNFKAATNSSDFELSAEEIFNYARTQTTSYTSTYTGINTQHPQIYDDITGELPFLVRVTADVKIGTSATGILTIDGTSYASSSLPQNFIWAPGSSHTVQAASTISGATGTRYVFTSWNDGNTSSSRSFSAGGSFRADYKTQYYLTVTSAHGDATGAGWYDSDSAAPVSLTTPVEQSGTKYIFTAWSGDYTGDTASIQVTMSKPKTVTAAWKTQYYLTVKSVYGSPTGTGWYDAGTNAGITIPNLVEQPGTRHNFAGWSGDYSGSAASSSVSMDKPKTVTAAWQTDYQLTVTSEYGEPQGAGWYNSGSTATISVKTPVGMIIRKVFNGWSGDYSGSAASSSVVMDRPKDVTATWKSDFMQLYILITIVVVLILGGLTFLYLKIRKPKAPVTVSSSAAPPPAAPLRCSHCGADLETGDAFCIKCGKPIKDN